MQQAVTRIGAKRLVVDSLNGLELALAPTFREDFRESLHRLFGQLTGSGVSILLTVEVTESFNDISFSNHAVSFLTQNIIFMRYAEMAGRLRRMIAVIKMRRSAHSHELREYEITSTGVKITSSLSEYQGLLTGSPTRSPTAEVPLPGLIAEEATILERLRAQGASTEADLARAAAFPPARVGRALRRLVELAYAEVIVEGNRQIYRSTEGTGQTRS